MGEKHPTQPLPAKLLLQDKSSFLCPQLLSWKGYASPFQFPSPCMQFNNRLQLRSDPQTQPLLRNSGGEAHAGQTLRPRALHATGADGRIYSHFVHSVEKPWGEAEPYGNSFVMGILAQ